VFSSQCDNLLPSAKVVFIKVNYKKNESRSKNNNRKYLEIFLIPFSLTLTQELQDRKETLLFIRTTFTNFKKQNVKTTSEMILSKYNTHEKQHFSLY